MDNVESTPVVRVNDASAGSCPDSPSLASTNLIGIERNDQTTKEPVIDLDRDENANNKSHRNDIGKHREINHVNHHIPIVHLMTEQDENQQQLTNSHGSSQANVSSKLCKVLLLKLFESYKCFIINFL